MSNFKHDGKYTARAVGEVVLGKSKEKGTPFIEFYLSVTQGELEGRKVRWTGYFTDGTIDRTIDSLRTCGWTGDNLTIFQNGKLNGLDSKEVEIVVALEEFTNQQGETKNSVKVAWINSGVFVNTAARMSEDDALAFGAKFNHKLTGKSAEPSDPNKPPF